MPASVHCEQIRHKCDVEQGLGDNLKRWLTSWGITKERYVEVKELFGLPPTCNCDSRAEWLNRLGAHFGIATDKYGPNKGEDNA